MTARIVIIGAGDLGRTLAAHLEDDPTGRAIGFYDDHQAARGTERIDDLPVIGAISDIPRHHAEGKFNSVLMGIGYKHLDFRAHLFATLRTVGVPVATFIHPSAFVHRSATVGMGAILFPRCVVDVKTRIGMNSLLNTGCIIAHDTSIGEGCFLGPGVTFRAAL